MILSMLRIGVGGGWNLGRRVGKRGLLAVVSLLRWWKQTLRLDKGSYCLLWKYWCPCPQLRLIPRLNADVLAGSSGIPRNKTGRHCC